MSVETSKKTTRLTPNERAQIISDFNAGNEISNKDYYVIKSKKGVINVRRKKEETHKPSEKKKEKKEHNYATLKTLESTFRIPIKNIKFNEGFLTVEQENTMYKIPAEEVSRKKKVKEEIPKDEGIKEKIVNENIKENNKEEKPKAL